MGSCTLEIVCQRPAPEAVAASTVVGDPALIPSGTILMTIGAAYTNAATIAVNRDGPNSATNGTRYTNGGMTCAASSTGRITRSAPRLRPIQTPISTPTTITMTVATSVDASVVIASFHRPVASSSARQIAVTTVARTPPTTTANAMITAHISHHGDSVSSASNGLSTARVKPSRRSLVMTDRLSWIHSVMSLVVREIHGPMFHSIGNSAAHT